MKNLKESPATWNFALRIFKQAFKLTSNADLAFRVTFDKISDEFPDLEYDEDSFVGPMIGALKNSQLLDNSYEFKKKDSFDDEFLARFDAKLEYEKLLGPIENNARASVFKEKADEIAAKMSGLNEEQKRIFAFKLNEIGGKLGKVTGEQVKNIYCFALGLPSNIK